MAYIHIYGAMSFPAQRLSAVPLALGATFRFVSFFGLNWLCLAISVTFLATVYSPWPSSYLGLFTQTHQPLSGLWAFANWLFPLPGGFPLTPSERLAHSHFQVSPQMFCQERGLSGPPLPTKSSFSSLLNYTSAASACSGWCHHCL